MKGKRRLLCVYIGREDKMLEINKLGLSKYKPSLRNYLSSLRNSLPTVDFGISSMKTTCLGTL